MIEDGYVAVYFEVNKTTPTKVLIGGLDYIKTYLKKNPNAIVTIIGHCDVTSPTQLNDKPGTERAKSVKNILIDSGINESQLIIMSQGEDQSAGRDLKSAKKLLV